jgi:hypothetical protein
MSSPSKRAPFLAGLATALQPKRGGSLAITFGEVVDARSAKREEEIKELPAGIAGLVLRVCAYLGQGGATFTGTQVRDWYLRVAEPKEAKDPEAALRSQRNDASTCLKRLLGSGWLDGDPEGGYTLRQRDSKGVRIVLPPHWINEPVRGA